MKQSANKFPVYTEQNAQRVFREKTNGEVKPASKKSWKWMSVALFAFFYLGASTWFGLIVHICMPSFRKPIHVKLEGLTPADQAKVRVTFLPIAP